MIKKAMEFFGELCRPEKIEIDDDTYLLPEYRLVSEPEAESFITHTLTSLADYIKANPDEIDLENIIAHVVDTDAVRLRTAMFGHKQRETLVSAVCNNDSFNFGRYMELEDFTIAVQSLFADGGNKADVLEMVGNIISDSLQVSVGYAEHVCSGQ